MTNVEADICMKFSLPIYIDKQSPLEAWEQGIFKIRSLQKCFNREFRKAQHTALLSRDETPRVEYSALVNELRVVNDFEDFLKTNVEERETAYIKNAINKRLNKGQSQTDIINDIRAICAEAKKQKTHQNIINFNTQPVIDAWNELAKHTELKPVFEISKTSVRYKNLVSRINEHGVDTVIKTINSVQNSDFLKGNNERGWTVTFDWIVKPTNFQKVMEGQYENPKKKKLKSEPSFDIYALQQQALYNDDFDI